MSSDPSPTPPDDDHGPLPAPAQQQQKRTRILLSCAACRASKLKCDRQDPCSQCLKKGRADACRYAPRPQKPPKPARTMAARLRRLEGMVRGMLDESGASVAVNPGAGGSAQGRAVVEAKREEGSNQTASVKSCALTAAAAAVAQNGDADAGGQVVSGDLGATSYIGGTHFAAILQDVSLI